MPRFMSILRDGSQWTVAVNEIHDIDAWAEFMQQMVLQVVKAHKQLSVVDGALTLPLPETAMVTTTERLTLCWDWWWLMVTFLTGTVFGMACHWVICHAKITVSTSPSADV